MNQGKITLFASLAFASLPLISVRANTVLFDLSAGNFSQDWTNTGLITANDDWSGVGSIVGYRGDDASLSTGVDPQTIVSPTFSTVVNVTANQTVTTATSGGVYEFELANPVVGMQGSGTADAPNLVLYLNAAGRQSISISYNLRDVDTTTDNSVQAFALQYRVGGSGNFINVPSGFVADASSGPSIATLVTPVSATLPVEANDAANLQLRIITTNAVGNDEFVGIDDIVITSAPVPEPSSALALIGGVGLLIGLRRRSPQLA